MNQVPFQSYKVADIAVGNVMCVSTEGISTANKLIKRNKFERKNLASSQVSDFEETSLTRTCENRISATYDAGFLSSFPFFFVENLVTLRCPQH